MSKLDFGFNQWSVVSFVVKKLYVYLFMVKQCTYLVILMYFMQLYSHLLWSGNKFADFVVFFVDPTRSVNYQENKILRRFKESR